MILIIIMVVVAAALVIGLIVCKRCERKHLQEEKAEPDIFLMILPSMLGIGACCLCLIGGTYAWFTANVITPAQTIQAANYDINVSIQCGEETIDPDSATDAYTYTLSSQIDDSGNPVGYTVTLTAGGTASTGYCKITKSASGSVNVDAAQSEDILNVEESSAIDAAPSDAQTDAVAADGTVFYTVQINNVEQFNSFTFTIYPAMANEQYTFEAVWGTYSGTDGIGNGSVIGTPPSASEAPSAEAETTTDGTGDAAGSSDGAVENTEGISDVTETQSGTEAQPAAEETQSETEAQTAAAENTGETASESELMP